MFLRLENNHLVIKSRKGHNQNNRLKIFNNELITNGMQFIVSIHTIEPNVDEINQKTFFIFFWYFFKSEPKIFYIFGNQTS